MGVTKAIVLGVLILSLSGCGVLNSVGGLFGGGRVFGDGGASSQGLPFRATIRRGQDRRDFTVKVRAAAATVPQARESARFPATRYCLANFGGSDADWVIDPATGDWAVTRERRSMIFQGRCTAR